MDVTELTRIRALAEKSSEHFSSDAWYLPGAFFGLLPPCDQELIEALDPATVKQLCETALRNTAQAQVSDAEVEAACVAAYSACDMGSFPAMAVEPDSDRRIIRAALEAAARARGTGEALAGDIARRAIAAQSSAKGVE